MHDYVEVGHLRLGMLCFRCILTTGYPGLSFSYVPTCCRNGLFIRHMVVPNTINGQNIAHLCFQISVKYAKHFFDNDQLDAVQQA